MRGVLFALTMAVGSLLAGCGSINATASQQVGTMLPQWMGGMPADVPPRRGTAEYEEWQAKREFEARRPKTIDEPARSIPVAPTEGNR